MTVMTFPSFMASGSNFGNPPMGNYETRPKSVVPWVYDWNGAEVCYDGCAEDARLFCAGLKLMWGFPQMSSIKNLCEGI